MTLPVRKVALVAGVAIVVGFAGSYLAQRPSGVALLRGETIAVPQVSGPNDETIPATKVVFEWKATTPSTRLVVVDLGQPEKPAIDREVSGDRYEPDAAEKKLFISGRAYHWYVQAKGSDGHTRSSAAAQFEVR